MDESFVPDRDDQASRHQRGEPRDSMLLQATMHVPGQPAPVALRIRNLSAGGMMGEPSGPLMVGQSVTVDLRNIGTVAGTIAWVEAPRFGVAFDNPIDPQLARKPVGTHAADSRLVRPSQAKVRRPGLRLE